MMELRHLAMVNWHLFDIEDVEVAGHIGMLGENRSGKSTVLDMAQVVFTGGNRRFLRLNAVAGDKGRARSGSKRSVVDYCLGTLGEDQRRRDDARTYIALGFADTEGQRPPVTIGMAMEARKADSKETVLALFVAVGRICRADDFVEVRENGDRFPAEWEDVRQRIVAAVGSHNFVNHRDKATDFVREYMRHLLPHVPYVEQNAIALQKSIVNAMTLDHNQTATEFVREYILENNPIQVGELRESIQTYRNINETIRKMREKLDALKALQAIIAELDDALERMYREHWVAKRAEWLAARAANREIKEKLKTEVGKRDAAGKEVAFLDDEIRGIDAEINRLSIAIAEHDAKTGRQRLVDASKNAEQAASRAAADFRKRLDTIRALHPLCGLRGFGFDEYIPLIEAVTAKASESRIDHVLNGMGAAEAAVRSADANFLTRVETLKAQAYGQLGNHQRQQEELLRRVSEHQLGQVAAHISPVTDLLCLRLRQNGMAPRVLCNLVEVTDPDWIGAAEALLGRDREAVFVDRADIAAATALFKEGRREFKGASLVSLNKLEQFRTPPQPGTFPSVFRSQDADAMSFIMRRYGNVRLARNLQEFNAPGRAIMTDGLYDDGLVRTHRFVEQHDYKIGKAAQADAVRRLHDQVEENASLIERAIKLSRSIDGAYNALHLLREEPSNSLEAIATAFAAAQKEKVEAESRLQALDTAGDGGLRGRRDAQMKLKGVRDRERNTQQGHYNRHDSQVGLQQRLLTLGDGTPGSTLNLNVAWSIFKGRLPLYDVSKGRQIYRTRFDARGDKDEQERHRTIAGKAISAVAAADSDRVSAERRIREALVDYFNTIEVSSQVGVESDPLREVRPWADQLIQDIESNELRRYERQASEAADKAATLLRGEFINALTSRISKMERDLRAVDRGLQEHPFHNERYSFHHSSVVEFRPILKIIEISKISPDALDMLFRADVPENFPYKDTIEALKTLLEDPSKDVSAFEDYRNFYTFEIHMEDVVTGRTTRWESRRGTGSGAEQQVPIYVAIGASLASVYGSADRRPGKSGGLALAIFDEAFSKMDGKNQRQMMHFYKNLGLQVVIAAPFEKRVAILEHMETIVEIDRIGEQSKATVVQIKDRARNELMALNPDLMNDDQVARLAAE